MFNVPSSKHAAYQMLKPAVFGSATEYYPNKVPAAAAVGNKVFAIFILSAARATADPAV